MKSVLIQFPGSNRDRDMIAAIEKIGGAPPIRVWHTDSELPEVDLIVIPGGFSYGDYLRSGAIAARSPIMNAVRKKSDAGTKILGVCNGFQILTEAGLLPGALMRNSNLLFVCKTIKLKVENAGTAFSNLYKNGDVFDCPVAHHDGNYFADEAIIQDIEDNNQVVFRYVDKSNNPNGSINNIAGIVNKAGNVLGMMPHPENRIEPEHGGTEGRAIFEAALTPLIGEAA